jgi:hypothetical protein
MSAGVIARRIGSIATVNKPAQKRPMMSPMINSIIVWRKKEE